MTSYSGREPLQAAYRLSLLSTLAALTTTDIPVDAGDFRLLAVRR
jgi:hypothetical protein